MSSLAKRFTVVDISGLDIDGHAISTKVLRLTQCIWCRRVVRRTSTTARTGVTAQEWPDHTTGWSSLHHSGVNKQTNKQTNKQKQTKKQTNKQKEQHTKKQILKQTNHSLVWKILISELLYLF